MWGKKTTTAVSMGTRQMCRVMKTIHNRRSETNMKIVIDNKVIFLLLFFIIRKVDFIDFMCLIILL